MHSARPLRSRLAWLLAFAAVGAQLWLGAAHAVMAPGGAFCGGGDPALRARLSARLPAELRQLKPAQSAAQCLLCALAHAPALPSSPAPDHTVSRLAPHPGAGIAPAPAAAPSHLLPPPRGPPTFSRS